MPRDKDEETSNGTGEKKLDKSTNEGLYGWECDCGEGGTFESQEERDISYNKHKCKYTKVKKQKKLDSPVSIERMAEILGVNFYDLHPLVMARENHLIKDAKTQERKRLKGIILPQLLAISESLPASASDWPEHTRATFLVIRQALKGD